MDLPFFANDLIESIIDAIEGDANEFSTKFQGYLESGSVSMVKYSYDILNTLS